MSVNPVNSYSNASVNYEQPVYSQMDYSGYKLTKQGNLYKESNSVKTIAPIVVMPLPLLSGIIRKKFFNMPISNSEIFRQTVQGSLLWLGLGTLIDKAIDSSRAKRADELAELNTRSYYG